MVEKLNDEKLMQHPFAFVTPQTYLIVTATNDPNEKEPDLVSKYLIQGKNVVVPFIPCRTKNQKKQTGPQT